MRPRYGAVVVIPMLVAACAGGGQASNPGPSAPRQTTGAPATAASTAPIVSASPAATATQASALCPAASAASSPGCISSTPGLAAILALDPQARLSCFGGSTLTFEAMVSKPISDCGVGPRVEPAWFCFPGVFLTVPSPSADTGLPPLDVYWNPVSPLTAKNFPAGTTLRVTGHFDDPAAATCRITSVPIGQSQPPAADVVLTCREAFIVTAVQ